MLIPLIPKDPEANDFTCRDGEIEFIMNFSAGSDEGSAESLPSSSEAATAEEARKIRFALTADRQFPTFNIRIPLKNGDAEKAALLLGGEISRVDCETADRLTQAIVEKAADGFFSSATDLRRSGLFILPFRVFCRVHNEESGRSFPTPQAVMLPSEFPPHPEITASSIASDTLTLSLRIPVRPARMSLALPQLIDIAQVETFASYPLYLPDPKETRGTLGSVRSATGGNATGIRFSFLSESALKVSVAAPDKYYLLQGNPRTGYKYSSKATPMPDYSVYSGQTGSVRPFAKDSLLQKDCDADPFDWIADWRETTDGCLPLSLRTTPLSDTSSLPLPAGIDAGKLREMCDRHELPVALLTRPLALGTGSNRRNAARRGINRLKIHGLMPGRHKAALFGSDNGYDYALLRVWDPTKTVVVMSPPRRWHRVMIMSERIATQLCLEVE